MFYFTSSPFVSFRLYVYILTSHISPCYWNPIPSSEVSTVSRVSHICINTIKFCWFIYDKPMIWYKKFRVDTYYINPTFLIIFLQPQYYFSYIFQMLNYLVKFCVMSMRGWIYIDDLPHHRLDTVMFLLRRSHIPLEKAWSKKRCHHWKSLSRQYELLHLFPVQRMCC